MAAKMRRRRFLALLGVAPLAVAGPLPTQPAIHDDLFEWSDDNSIVIGDDDDPITGLREIAGRLVVFTEKRVFALDRFPGGSVRRIC